MSANKALRSRISSDGSTCIDPDYYWQELDNAPHGVKVQLLSIYGVAVYGTLSGAAIKTGFWQYWAPLPKVKKEQ